MELILIVVWPKSIRSVALSNKIFSLTVFSSPHCGPCNNLAPELEKFHLAHPELEVVMISKGEPKENRAKVKEHRSTDWASL